MRRFWYAAAIALLVTPATLAPQPGAAASDGAHISEIKIQPQTGLLQIIVRADSVLAFAVSSGDAGTVVVKLTNALLPPSFPNFQTIPDPVVQSLTAQQTAVAPPSALIAIAVRSQVAVTTSTFDAGKTLAININTNVAAQSTRPEAVTPAAAAPSASPATAAQPFAVPGGVSATAAPSLAPMVRSEPPAGVALIRPSGARAGAITLREDGVALRDALLDVADASGVTMIVGDDVSGRVTVELRNASLERALHTLLDPKGIPWRRAGATIIVGHPGAAGGRAAAHRDSAAFPLANIDARTAAGALRPLFPRAAFSASASSNAVIVAADPAELSTIRSVIAGLDVQSPNRRTGEAVPLRYVKARDVLAIVRGVYPRAQVTLGPNNALVIAASAVDLPQVKNLIASLDAPPVTAGGTEASEVVRLLRNSAAGVARAVAPAFPKVRFSTTGSTLVISGAAEDVARAKAIALAADLSPAGAVSSQLYKLRFALAPDVAGALRKTFRSAQIAEDIPTNSVVVQASEAVQSQVAATVGALDAGPQLGGGGLVSTTVIQLQNAVPAVGATGSTTAGDIASSLTAILGPSAPDLRVTVPANTTLLAISGSPATLKAAQDLLLKIDVPATQITLDTAVYEVDENAARNIGLQIPGAVISSTLGEIVSPNAANGQVPLRIQQFGRTPISFQAQINLLMSNGNARVLANPRVTTISGRTATIRAGDNIPFVQNVPGGITGVVTQTVLTFQTGVTLDITPIANPDGKVSVTLHPIVNSETGQTVQGAPPRISSREAQTTVNLNDNDTVVIGGLIQETTQTSQQRVPGLSSIPLLGGLFKNSQSDVLRTELIIVVTPHVILPGHSPSEIQKPPVIPTPRLAPIVVPANPPPAAHR